MQRAILLLGLLLAGCAAQPAAAVHRATTSRACLTPGTRAILRAAEAHFNTRFTLVSTCRPGALLAGTHEASQHAFGRAVDLVVPGGPEKKYAVVRWLYAHTRGLVMTYYDMPHVHFDTGPYHALTRGFGRPSRWSGR